MVWEHLLAFGAALFIAAVIPGPGIMAVTGCALGRGSRAALAMTGGVIIGDLVYLTLAVFGLSVMAQSMGDLFMVVRLAGAAYLIWLGIKLWRAPGTVAALDSVPATGRGVWRETITGLAVTLGNPKTIAFYLGLLPNFIDLARVTPTGYMELISVVCVILILGVGPYAIAAGRMRLWMRAPHRVRWMNRGAGSIMIGTGTVLAAKS